MKITIEHFADGYRCLLHTRHEAYFVGPVSTHAECQYIRDEILEAARQPHEVKKAVGDSLPFTTTQRESA